MKILKAVGIVAINLLVGICYLSMFGFIGISIAGWINGDCSGFYPAIAIGVILSMAVFFTYLDIK